MRRFSIVVAFVAALGVFGAGRAEALSVRDIIELSKAGLGDDILLALIEVERKVFPVDAATLKQLKEAGVTDRVIVAMVRSGRMPAPLPPEPVQVVEPVQAPPPQVVVIDHEPRVREVEVRQVVVPVPVYVPVRTRQHDDSRVERHELRQPRPTVPFSTIGLPHAPMSLSPIRRKSDPPYWWEMQQPRK